MTSDQTLFPVTNGFQCIQMDIVGPLPPSKPLNELYITDFCYLVTFADRATCWLEAVPVSNICAETIAAAFLSVWISRFTHFGIPLFVVTDRGRQFESEMFSHLAKLVGFHRVCISAYLPQSTGFIER